MKSSRIILQIFVATALLPASLHAEQLHVLGALRATDKPHSESKHSSTHRATGSIKMPVYTITGPSPQAANKKPAVQKSAQKKAPKSQTTSR